MINFNSKFVKVFKAIYERKHINYFIGHIHITHLNTPRATVGGHNYFMLLQVMATPTKCFLFLSAG